MQITPVSEINAEGVVKESYNDLKSALGVHSLPLFFSYIGPFPEYLSYISKQLIVNLNDIRFTALVNDAAEQFKTLIESELRNSQEKNEWLLKFSNTPTYFYFKKDTEHIFITNIKLCLIFIALREAVKGWAVAARQLKSSFTEDMKQQTNVDQDIASEMIYEEVSSTIITSTQGMSNRSQDITAKGNELVQVDPSSIEKNLLPEYLLICRNDFGELMKQERFLMARLTTEKLLLSYIGLLPGLIFSPINVVLDLTSKYQTFPELLYLLSEHFPTYAVQRMMFSGYMMK
ncbi:MAG: hypothetical protein ABIO02_02090 [Patescibacteria group bacterium]